MNFLDIRTVMFGQFLTDALCTLVLIYLWLQNRKRYPGISYWVMDTLLQTLAAVLIVLRGILPDWLSIGVSSPLVMTGAWFAYQGLAEFVGKKKNQAYNLMLLGVFILVHLCFTFIQPNLEARNINVSAGLLVISLQCAWLMGERNEIVRTRIRWAVGRIFRLFCLVSVIRIFIILISPSAGDNFFQSGFYDALVLLTYQILLILLTFGLTLMVNWRLLQNVRSVEEKFTKAFQSSPNAILISRLLDGRILDVNRSFEEITGYSSAEVVGKTLFDLGLWSNANDHHQVLAELTAGREVQGKEYQFRAKSGRDLTGLYYAENLAIENEQLVLSSISDISGRKQAEITRSQSEERYHSLFANMLNGFAYCQMIFDGEKPADFIYLDVNFAFETLTGLKDVIGKRVSQVIPGILETDPGLIQTYGRVALTGQPEVFETYVKALEMWFSISVYRPEDGFFVAVFDVITERKKNEEKLRADETRLHLALDAAKGGVWEWNLRTNENIWSEELWKVYGLEPHICEPSFEAWQQTIHPDDREGAAQAVMQAAQNAAELNAEWRVCDPDGTERWLMSRGQPIFDTGGQVKAYIGTALDITARKMSEGALRESEEKFRKAFLTSPDAININRLSDGKYVTANHGFSQILGYSEAEVIGKTSLELNIWVSPEDRKAWVDLLNQKGTVLNFDARFRAKNGEIHDCTTSASAFELGGVPHIISITRDVTERKKMEADLQKLNAELEQRVRERTAELSDLYHHAPCGYHSLDSEGTFIRVNDTELSWLGYTREEFEGKKRIVDLLTSESRQVFEENFPVFKQNGWINDLKMHFKRKDGSILPVLVSATAILDQEGHYKSSRSTMIDYSALKQAEEAIHQSKYKLETVNRELEAFAYSVSHDLRAPLRGIDGWSHALLEDYQDRLDEQGQLYIERIRSEAKRMGQLIDDMLQLSRVTRVEMKIGAVDLSHLAQNILARLAEMQPDRQVEIAIQPGLTATGDAALLEIVLTNFLDNAWKFTGKRDGARIEFGQIDQDGEHVFFVRDNGAGFDVKYAHKLFGAFQRLHKTTDFPGTGVGLATVNRIINRHGGRVWVEALVDRGATFYFTLEEKI